MIEGFLLGVIVTGSAVAGAFFLKFWKQTRDLLFLGFGAAFLIEAVNRTMFALTGARHEEAGLYYLIRLGSYLLILWAIFAKNFPRRSG